MSDFRDRRMSRYSNYRNPPATYLEKAESALVNLDPGMFTNDTDTINYAQALIALAEAQMKGSTRV